MIEERAARAVQLFEGSIAPIGRAATVGNLAELVEAFSRLPYENLSKIVAWNRGRPSGPSGPLRDPLTVVEEHLSLGTGGTCFSLTELLVRLAGAAGLSARPVMAHMRHGWNIHCAVRVDVGKRAFLVDPGYLLREPLPLGASPPAQRQPGAPLLVAAGSLGEVPEGVPGGDFDLYTLEAEGPRWRYRFSDRSPSREEFLQHWRESFTRPAMRSLVATRRTDEELLYLHNHKLRRQDGAEARTSNVRTELPGSVQRVFGIDPEVTRRAAALLRAEREAWRQRAAAAGEAR